MKSFQDRISEVPRGGWIRAGIWSTLYVAFVFWVAWGDWASLGWLVLLPLVVDMFTTKYINYSWWRKYKPEESKVESQKSKAGNAFLIRCSVG
jgi:signal peptidase I